MKIYVFYKFKIRNVYVVSNTIPPKVAGKQNNRPVPCIVCLCMCVRVKIILEVFICCAKIKIIDSPSSFFVWSSWPCFSGAWSRTIAVDEPLPLSLPSNQAVAPSI